MKKLLKIALLIVLIISVMGGCLNNDKAKKAEYKANMESSEIIYPLYERLDDKEKDIYVSLCTAIENHRTSSILIGEYSDTKAADEAIIRTHEILLELVYEHPEYFWVDSNTLGSEKFTVKDNVRARVTLNYIIDKEEAESKKVLFDEKIEEIVKNAKYKGDLYQKVLYVYDTILFNVSYDYDLLKSSNTKLGHTAYGCLVEGKTICSGYSMAFNLLMRKLGIESGSEFNDYDNWITNQVFNPVSAETLHVWNYAKLDDEYYYFDLTWDDTIFDSEEHKPYIDYSHMYFAIARDELAKSNLNLVEDAPTPRCNGTKYNYFRKNVYNISVYNFDAAKALILPQSNEKYAQLRFDNHDELVKAEIELMEKGRIYEILPEEENIRYVVAPSGLHLYIFYD